jgi:hypothetical protein
MPEWHDGFNSARGVSMPDYQVLFADIDCKKCAKQIINNLKWTPQGVSIPE